MPWTYACKLKKYWTQEQLALQYTKNVFKSKSAQCFVAGIRLLFGQQLLIISTIRTSTGVLYKLCSRNKFRVHGDYVLSYDV